MPARWQDAMFERNRQIQFLESPQGQSYMRSFEEGMRSKDYGDDKFHTLPEGIIWRTAYQTCLQGDPIYIHDHVIEIIDSARDSFLPEIVLPTDPFCAVGFAWLARSLSILDVYEKRTPVRAIGWMPVRAADEDGMERGGLWITMWKHRDDDEEYSDYYNPNTQTTDASGPYGVLQAIHSFFLNFNHRQWEDIERNATSERDLDFMAASIRQWTTVQVMWRLGQQLVQTGQQAPRQARKEAKRMGARNDSGITVITLRRPRSDNGHMEFDEGEKRYHFQWMVRGHWRNQWYPSLKEHRQKWISGYWKGDPDDPIRLTERVFDFKR
jgi:hypothetical protein